MKKTVKMISASALVLAMLATLPVTAFARCGRAAASTTTQSSTTYTCPWNNEECVNNGYCIEGCGQGQGYGNGWGGCHNR